MAGKNIVEVTDQDFQAKVLQSEQLVMVDFWATCLALGPTLEALADDFAGKVVVAKLNVDENREVAAGYRITSIPTVLFFKGGQLVDSVVGARPKAQYKELVERHL